MRVYMWLLFGGQRKRRIHQNYRFIEHILLFMSAFNSVQAVQPVQQGGLGALHHHRGRPDIQQPRQVYY